MKQNVPSRLMRENPDLEQLKRQAKELLQAFAAGEPAARAEVSAHYHSADHAKFALHDAQLVVARSYGFDSWPKLKAYVDGVTIKRLVEAVRQDDLEQVRAMITARPELANMALSYGDERRAIHFAVMQRLQQMVRLLMQNGADAHAGVHPHRDTTTAWILAKERGYQEIVAIIEEEEGRRAPSSSSDEEEEPLRGDETARAAVASGDVAWLQKRHAEGSLANVVRWDGGGLLTVAVENDRPDVLELLLDYGFDPNERVSEGEGDWISYSQGYPLWYSAASGKLHMAEILLRRGADPNVHMDSSGSPVHSAYSHKQWEMVALLRARGGMVTADTAAIYRETDLARRLLAEDSPGVVAEDLLSFGADGGAVEIVRMALEHVTWPADDSRWFRALTNPLYFWHHIPWLEAGNREFDRIGYLECFALILPRCGPHVMGAFGRTAMHEVASMRDHITDAEVEPFAKALLDAGFKGLNARDHFLNSTPLGWACRWGRAGLAKLLLERGADVNEPDAEPWARPRAWAEKMGHKNVLEVLK